jgi:ribosomal protein L13E
MQNGKKEAKNSEFHIPNSEFGNARSARRILRKPVEASKDRASPADAFCPEAPYPRATTQPSRKCRTLGVPRQSRGFTLKKLRQARKILFPHDLRTLR